ncbi:MAG: hypothetical protein ACR2MD_06040 [Aridibacter sp.]
MKILIENYSYDADLLKGFLPKRLLTFLNDGKASVDFVGYFNNFADKETVIILPKIFLENDKVFANIPPNEFIERKALDVFTKYGKTKSEIDFIFRFSFTFYLSLREFQKRNPHNIITQKEHTKNIISNLGLSDISELDLIFNLLKFYRENRDLILFKQKLAEKQKFKKTNWAKTVRKSLPFFQNKIPIYLESAEKEKRQDNENELLRIFYDLLFRLKAEFDLKIQIDSNLYQGFQKDFEKKSLRKLKAIRNKYFADKFKYLLNLLLAYFEKRAFANTKKDKEEFILCRNYNIVFEDMIDKLLSDENDKIEKLKNQADGKIVDHIFLSESLFPPKDIYYIGDSKYYKDTTAYSVNTIYKQHTYVKNVIQHNINLLNCNELPLSIRYRDELTEGYNITPNFFIQGFIEHKDLLNRTDKFRFDDSKSPKLSYQFKNRLFDRDTLIILDFKVNFLFVVDSYITNDRKKMKDFKKKASDQIRDFSVKHFNKTYEFYTLQPEEDIKIFLKSNFKLLLGKIYRDSQDQENLILALAKEFNADNRKLKTEIAKQNIKLELFELK